MTPVNPHSASLSRHFTRLTLIVHVLRPVEGGVEAQQACVGVIAAAAVVVNDAHALLPQVAHEELQADQGKDAEAEHGENHHVRQLLHRLDQGAHDGLQA